MAYSDFSIALVKSRLGLTVDSTQDLYSAVPESELPPILRTNLERYLALGLASGTEKARSELLIAPFLAELKMSYADRLGFFSGVALNVDESLGLWGRCDFVLTRNPEQLEMASPICVVVEAKHEDIPAGVPQCLAEMVAAQLFNEAAGTPTPIVHGAVTTGMVWRFLRLEGTAALVDRNEYTVQVPRKLMGILEHVTGVAPTER